MRSPLRGRLLAVVLLAAVASVTAFGGSAAAVYFTVVEYPNGEFAHAEDRMIRESATPPPTVDVIVANVRCPGAALGNSATHSCAELRGRRWWVWIDPAVPRELRRLVFYHELFHVRDMSLGPKLNRLRKRLREINGWSGGWGRRQWPSSFGPTEMASPAERAADASAWCGATPRSQWAALDPATAFAAHPSYLWQPTSAQFLATCEALRRGR